MKKLIIFQFSILISINSYGGIFNETTCFETDGQNIVYLTNETIPYTGNYLCKYDNGQKEQEGRYKDGRLIGKWTVWYESGQKQLEENYKNGKLDGKLIEWFQFNGEIKREENYKNGKILF